MIDGPNEIEEEDINNVGDEETSVSSSEMSATSSDIPMELSSSNSEDSNAAILLSAVWMW